MKKYSKLKAIDYCHKNGLEFISLFKQLLDTTNIDTQCKILNKMQIIFDKIDDIYITKSQNMIYHSQKMEWFYTVNSSYDELFDNNEVKYKYDKFVLLLEINKNAQLSFAQTSNQYCNTNFEKYNNILILDLLTTGTNLKKDKIIKFEYVLLNNKLDVTLSGEFFVKHNKLEISEKFKAKYNISLNDIKSGQDKNFIFDLIQRLIVPKKTLLVSYNINFIKKFLYKFLDSSGEDNPIHYLDVLDLSSLCNWDNQKRKIYNIKSAIKYYNIDCRFYKNNAMIYYVLLNEMIKKKDINLYIKPYKNKCQDFNYNFAIMYFMGEKTDAKQQ